MIEGVAHGRVNLLGEHTDYNEGLVLPTVVPQAAHVRLREIEGPGFVLNAEDLHESVRFTLERAPAQHFATYVYGCLKEMSALVAVPPLEIHVHSEVPMGVGLSSSAALEVATLRALRALLRVGVDDIELARMAQRAENRYAGVNCGILDMMASSLAASGRLLFLDTRSLEHRLVPLPADAEILVLHSGIERSLAASGYNERRAECEAAARALRAASLREITEHDLKKLPEPLRRRARHVLSENQRVEAAIRGADARGFGALMNASHDSLRDDYEVSHPRVDALIARLRADARVYGAKLTGAGFGGAVVALCQAGAARSAGLEAVRALPSARLLVS